MLLRKGLILLILATISPPQLAWIVPQPKANVWATLAKSLNKDHICLSISSASDPLLSCLMGIPYQINKFPFTLPKPTSTPSKETRSFIAYQPDAWRRWVRLLPIMDKSPKNQIYLVLPLLLPVCISQSPPIPKTDLPLKSGRPPLSTPQRNGARG
ncbi:hypothetical protein RLOC_00000498 [Lonchura striata]|uniref:Uncharacterized protein n=1 Tax=Lonchura striata TaxID=40157 RepID=A0A218V4G2_9PASE|nr:hypothetical protein RLOC_00000498 [Lonchura striata domestica]